MPTSAPIDGFTVVIPAGGVGSRLWPLSRTKAPKFLLDLTGAGQSLLCQTWDRLVPLVGEERIMVVTGRDHRAAVLGQLPELHEYNVLVETAPRDSTAAIGLAAAVLERREPGVILGSFAADHVIEGQEAFEHAVRAAVEAARTGKIVTIGIRPTEPSTGFGYIHAGAPLGDETPDALTVERFVEKPDLETAEQYLADGGYLWNAGMFIAKASVILEFIRAYNPSLHAGLIRIAEAWDTPTRSSVVHREWPRLSKIAIDYSVAEPAAEAGQLAVVPGNFTWDDVGDFAALARLRTGGREGDLAILGEDARVLSELASGVIASETGRLVAVVGIDNVVVVDTKDALLVTTVEHAQRVKKLVEALRNSGDGDVL